MPKRKTEQEYIELATTLGWDWLGPYPDTVNDLTYWICANGHEIERSYKRAKERGCIYCNERWEKTMVDYVELGLLHGLRPPSELPANVRVPVMWTIGDGDGFSFTSYRNLLCRTVGGDGEDIDEDALEQFKCRVIFERTRREGRGRIRGDDRRDDSMPENSRHARQQQPAQGVGGGAPHRRHGDDRTTSGARQCPAKQVA